MKEFLTLNKEEAQTPIMPNHPHSISNIRPDTKIIDGNIEDEEVDGICADYGVITITKVNGLDNNNEDIEHICIKDDCDVSRYYGCVGGDDGFQKDNLFSELTDEYQRTIARINLGIADEYSLKWGNIKGNLHNQKDLYTFVTDSIAFDINKVIEEINLKLAQWACEIEIRFKNKADIFSPNFTGIPTTTLPLMTDNSNRIASTEWVNAKIASASIDENVKAISLEPEYMCYGDEPTDVKVTWEYYKKVDSQNLNGVTIPSDIREYTFKDVTTSMIVTLQYKYEEATASRVATFDIKYPIYYGTSPNYTDNKQTINNSFTIDAKSEEYLYIIIPNGLNAILAVSSVIGGFKLLGSQEIFGNIYYIFKSANSGLGETTVEILNQGNFESGEFDTTSIKELLASKADKYAVYSKIEIDKLLDGFDGNLTSYYTKVEVDAKIPDISNKANKSDIPTKTSSLVNDSGYLTKLPTDIITESKLLAKGYLTEELEPQFNISIAKNINASDINFWNNKVDKVVGMGLSQESFTQQEKAKLNSLNNYNDSALKKAISDLSVEVDNKANNSDIPDISGKADIADIPKRTSQLVHDSGFLTSIPTGLVTEEVLNNKGYLTAFTETDPTVPAWAKKPTKPVYTLEELGAEAVGSANKALSSAVIYIDDQLSIILGGSDPLYNTFKKIGDIISVHTTSINSLNTEIVKKAEKTELFSRKYSDLINPPIIPDITNLASKVYVNDQIAAITGTDLSDYAKKTDLPDISVKVDKVIGKGLSSRDFTQPLETKLISLENYNDESLTLRVITLEREYQNLLDKLEALELVVSNITTRAAIIPE